MEILIPLEGDSPTGLQAKELMGLTVNSINELSDSDVMDFKKFYEELYVRSFRALQTDAQRILSGFFRYPDGTFVAGKFNLNSRIASLETSTFINQPQVMTGQGGVRIQWAPSLYSVMVVNNIQVKIKTLQSPSIANLTIIDNITGFELLTKQVAVNSNINTIPLFFETNSQDFSILVDLADQEYYATVQRFYYNGSWIDEDVSCSMPCINGSNIISYQINGGGLNAQVTAICSLARFIQLNMPIFQLSLYYSIGREFMKERIASDRINSYTVLTIDRAEQLFAQYEKDYVNSLDGLRAINQVTEDYQCFSCKSVLSTHNLLP